MAGIANVITITFDTDSEMSIPVKQRIADAIRDQLDGRALGWVHVTFDERGSF